MKVKTVKKTLSAVHKAFYSSITDPKVKRLVKRNTIITGGCIPSMLQGEKVNDYDLYFKNHETVKAVCEYYTNMFIGKYPEYHIDMIETEDRIKLRVKSSGVAEAKTKAKMKKYEPVYISANAITLKGGIQLVVRFYGSVSEIHKNYDFVHCTCSWESETNELVLPSAALASLITKELKYQGSRYPLASMIRTRKFIKRGFSINAGQYLKMAMQLNELDLTDLEVFEDQLTGVDALYFSQLLSAIKSAKHLKERIDTNYVLAIIDRIFDR